jgi:uncharacterized protein YecE (DUF72 family)
MLVESGKFYPTARPSAEEMLRYYSSVFPTVEVDSPFYALPTRRNSQLWVERTPDNFTFHVKAFSLFTTHGTPLQRLPKDIAESLPQDAKEKRNLYLRDMPHEVMSELWRRYREALEPLHQADKLGLVLFQFPRWFVPSQDNTDHLLVSKEKLEGMKIAVEFRQKDWLGERLRSRTLAFLRENDLALVCVDEPQGFSSSVPPIAEATAEEAYIRFHGRNAETWEKRGISANERFNYWYKPEDLREWVPRIHHLEEETQRVHALFNTNHSNQGPANAQLLLDILA